MNDPPAIAGGTDCVQQKFRTFEAKPISRVELRGCVASNVSTPRGKPVASLEMSLLDAHEQHVAHSRGSDVHAIDLPIFVPGEPENVSRHAEMVLI